MLLKVLRGVSTPYALNCSSVQFFSLIAVCDKNINPTKTILKKISVTLSRLTQPAGVVVVLSIQSLLSETWRRETATRNVGYGGEKRVEVWLLIQEMRTGRGDTER